MTFRITKISVYLTLLLLAAVVAFAPVFSHQASALGSRYSTFGSYQCSDGIDNDGDGKIDGADPGCHGSFDDSEFDDPPTCPPGGCDPCHPGTCPPPTVFQCSDGIDNDGDGFVDFGPNSFNDPSCTSANDDSEAPRDDTRNFQCSDGIDNDGDGFIDFPRDPSCSSARDDSEAPRDDNRRGNLRVSCDVSDTRIEEGDRVTFEVDIDGGTPPYDIDWDGDISGNDERERVTFRREGEYDVEVEVRDARGDRDSDDCRTVHVEEEGDPPFFGGNRAPIFSSTPSASASVNQSYFYDANAFDPDGDRVTYSLASGPLGMSVNPSTGFVSWTPFSSQSNTTQFVTIRASDGRLTTTQNFSVFVRGQIIIPPIIQPPIITPVADLEIFNLRVDNDEVNNVIVSFETNIPASSQVAYSLTSHLEDRDARNYETRVGGPFNTTLHQVNLGVLEFNRTYYLRAIATAGNQTEITPELAFVQLPDGVVVGDTTGVGILDEFALVRVRDAGLLAVDNNLGLASALGVLGALLFNPWFLLLVIIALSVLLYLKRNRDTQISTHGPVEIKS